MSIFTINRPSRPHRPHRGFTDRWLTPRWILDPLGDFETDPCCEKEMPWRIATRHFWKRGLEQEWIGRVWLNPPYGPEAAKFMKRMAEHDHGMALVFARTETAWFHNYVWDRASALLFFHGRVHFCDTTGKTATGNAGGPSVLCAYGNADAEILLSIDFAGKFIDLR